MTFHLIMVQLAAVLAVAAAASGNWILVALNLGSVAANAFFTLDTARRS